MKIKTRSADRLLSGLVSAVWTPFHDDGSLWLEQVPHYVDYLIDNHFNGLYICGTTGEGPSMTAQERKAVAEAFVKADAGRVPAVIQIGSNSLGESCELAAHAESIGANAISASAPCYFKVTDTEILVEWMTKVAASAPNLPFYYYHIPVFTGASMDMGLFMRLMAERCPTFRGLKFSDSRGFLFIEATQYAGGKYEILWGTDEMLIAAFTLGACGGVGSTYALAPKLYMDMLAALEADDLKEAQRLQLLSWQMIKVVNKYQFHPACRYILKRAGVDLGPCRLPIAPEGTVAASADIDADLKKLGL